MEATEKYRGNNGSPIQRKSKGAPSNLASVWIYAGLVMRNMRELFARSFTMDGWFLMFDLGPYGSNPMEGFYKDNPAKRPFLGRSDRDTSK